MTRLAASGISLDFQPLGGLLERFTVHDAGRDIAPLHRAPWVGTGETMPKGVPPHQAWLGGDFFCAPFGGDENGSGLHGWPANADWTLETETQTGLTAKLSQPVQGARLEKGLGLIDGHPFVYQSHRFTGGAIAIAVSNHANVSVPKGALISTSPKRGWETPATPQESDPARGRSILTYPARTNDPARFPGSHGPVNLGNYPWGPAHEDFVIGIEAAPGLGWTAVVRPEEGDLFLSLRNSRDLPMTMLWHSNGGRDYAPWSGRHTGCLGVEEGAAAHLLALSSKADLTGAGALTLGGTVEVRHVIGAIDWPSGKRVAAVEIDGDTLMIAGADRAMRRVLFDTSYLFPK